MFILDTNVISELRKSNTGKADTNVTAWVNSVSTDSLFISAITLLELETGILRVEHRDHRQGAALRKWFESQVIPAFAERTLAINTAVARQCAKLHVPDPRSESDALIAATALVHGMTVVTRNINDFKETGVPLLNPWEATTSPTLKPH